MKQLQLLKRYGGALALGVTSLGTVASCVASVHYNDAGSSALFGILGTVLVFATYGAFMASHHDSWHDSREYVSHLERLAYGNDGDKYEMGNY